MRRIGLVLLASMAAVACGGGDGDDNVSGDDPSGSTSPPTGTPTPTAAAGAAGDTGGQAEPVPAIVAELREQGGSAELFTGINDLVTFVAADYSTGTDDPEAAAADYLATFADAYGVADPSARFDVVKVSETAAGTVVRLDQSLDGLPVFGGQITVAVVAGGTIDRVTGVVAPDATLAAPVLTAEDAERAALASPGVSGLAAASELVAYSPAVIEASPAPPVAAWLVSVVVEDEGAQLIDQVLVSAVDGTVLLVAGLDATENNFDVSDADNAVDADGDADISAATLVLQMNDGTLTQVATPDVDATDVASHMATTYGYFSSTFGRDGFDDAGGRCDIYVHVGSNWRNASANASCHMRYGDANPYANTLDVIAHEFGHAVNGQSAGLIYAGESGALNEHYSDFFAIMVSRDDWVVDIVNRDFVAPSIDQYSEFFYTTSDKGGVHTNSSIGNHTSFLVASSDLNVHAGTGVEVQGIGMGTTEQLWYATLMSLSPSTSFKPWACATIRTAETMGLSDDQVESVTNAMKAVELVDERFGRLSCAWEIRDWSSWNDPEPTETTSPAPEEEACALEGVWRLRDHEFLDQIVAAAGSGEGVTFEYVSGDYLLEIPGDGTATSTRDKWRLRAATAQGAVVFEISGTEQGTLDLAGSSLSFDAAASEATVTMFLEANGVLTPMPIASQQTVDLPSSQNSGTYSCENDVLSVFSVQDGVEFTSRFDRVG